MPDILQIDNLTKRFGPLVALDRVSFSVTQGEVHALLGENGAGKTTLMNAVFGLVRPDSGKIVFKGSPLSRITPQSAMQQGIGMVHQHFKLVDEFTVAENVALGSPDSRDALLNHPDSRLRRLIRETGLQVEPDTKIGNLPVGVRQRVEILKALYRGAELLILDEPTAVLAPQETNELFEVLKQLQQAGTSIVIITHKLREVIALSDRVTVLRAGKVAFHGATKDSSETQLASIMVGKDIGQTAISLPQVSDETLLEVENLGYHRTVGGNIDDASLCLRQGEILGIAGVEGNGQQTLSDLLSGVLSADSGVIRFCGRDITKEPTGSRHKAGVSHIPGDRQTQALILDFSLQENLLLGRWPERVFDQKGILQPRDLHKATISVINEYGIRGGHSSSRAVDLSGGNQQRFVIGRQLAGKPRVLVAVNPTRGLDIGAIEYVHQQIINHCSSGGAALIITSDLDEALKLSHRIAVLFRGRFAAEYSRPFDKNLIGLSMATGEEAG